MANRATNRIQRVVNGYIDGSGNFVETGAGSGGGAMTVADGADVALGATGDAAATAGSTGTVSAKLRFLTSILNTISSTLTSISGFVDGVETILTSLLASRSAVTFTHTAVGATGSSAQLVAANASRKYLLIQNVSDAVIAIAFQNGTPDVTSASEDGILIGPGGNAEYSLALGNLDTSRVNVISTAATKRVLVTEGA